MPGAAIAPEILRGLLFHGYATGVFSSNPSERATCESIPCHVVARGLHPDDDSSAHLRNRLLSEVQNPFVHIVDHAYLLAVATSLSNFAHAPRQLGHFIDAVYNRKRIRWVLGCLSTAE